MTKPIVAVLLAFALSLLPIRAGLAKETGAVVKVLELTTERNGEFFAKFSGNICDDPEAIQNIGQVLLTDPDTTPDGIRALVSTLQAAKLSNASVIVWTDGYSWGCRIRWVTLK